MPDINPLDLAEAYHPEFELCIRIQDAGEQMLATGSLKLPVVDGQITGLNPAIAEVLEGTAKFLREDTDSA